MKKTFLSLKLVMSLSFGTFIPLKVHADMFGGDIAVLVQILAQAIEQVERMTKLINQGRETVNLLQDLNRGVQDILRLAETAHVPIPAHIYEKAKKIDQAAAEAQRIYGVISDRSPLYTRIHFESGKEGLFLSQDAFEYSTFLDDQGSRVKSSSLSASMPTATRLTAQTLGVVLHAISHSNRIQAKQLEIEATSRLESTAREEARFDNFVDFHHSVETEMKTAPFNNLNSFGD